MNFTQFVKNYVDRNPGTKYSSALKDIDVKCLWRDYKSNKSRPPALKRGISPTSALSATPVGEMLMLNRALNTGYIQPVQRNPNDLFQAMNAPRQAVERRTMGTMTDEVDEGRNSILDDDTLSFVSGFSYRDLFDDGSDDDEIIVDMHNPYLDYDTEVEEEQVPTFERPNVVGPYSLGIADPLGPGVTLPQYQRDINGDGLKGVRRAYRYGTGLKKVRRAYNYGTGMRRKLKR